MRIIGGVYKGKNIFFQKVKTTRPLKDAVKENIFNIIQHSNLLKIDLKKTKVLDLYSGSGSFGLECLSRGAASVTFVERDRKVADLIKKNLINLQIDNKAEIINNEIINFIEKNILKFDIIFFDPPFSNTSFLEELKLIKIKKMFKNKHLVIIHRENKNYEDFKNLLNILIVKKYGRSKIIFGKI